jgi:hypothetical protein
MLMKTDVVYQNAHISYNTITGRNLAHGHRSVVELAFVGGDLNRNQTQLVSPTLKQCAVLIGVCVPYIRAAIEISDDPAARRAVLAGDVSLFDARKATRDSETIAEHFARSTPADWLEAARAVGAAAVWDHMIAPLV